MSRRDGEIPNVHDQAAATPSPHPGSQEWIDKHMARARELAVESANSVLSTNGRELLFEVAREFVTEEWSEPVRYRFVRTEGGLLSMELRRV